MAQIAAQAGIPAHSRPAGRFAGIGAMQPVGSRLGVARDSCALDHRSSCSPRRSFARPQCAVALTIPTKIYDGTVHPLTWPVAIRPESTV